jgi:signal transduction histidine kinase
VQERWSILREFWLTFIVFCGLWSDLLWESWSVHTVFIPLIFLFVFSLIAFFFVGVGKNLTLLFSFLLIIVGVIFFFVSESMHRGVLYLMVMFLVFLSSKYLIKQSFFLYATVGLVLLIGSAFFHSSSPISLSGFFIFFTTIVMLYDQSHRELASHRELYDQLLGEYRAMKRLGYENERTTRIEERTRIARDIHDSVGHKLTALYMHIEISEMKKASLDTAVLKKYVNDSLEETRHAVKTLKAGEVEGIGSVLQLIRKLESESHIIIHFTTKQGALTANLTNRQSVVLYRVIQEALTNAMRHAQTREVYLSLGKTAIGDLAFSIENRIHDTSEIREGFGLVNMRKRVEEISGTIRILKTEGKFIVQGFFPIEKGIGM